MLFSGNNQPAGTPRKGSLRGFRVMFIKNPETITSITVESIEVHLFIFWIWC